MREVKKISSIRKSINALFPPFDVRTIVIWSRYRNKIQMSITKNSVAKVKNVKHVPDGQKKE